jgi:hypothetical protein
MIIAVSEEGQLCNRLFHFSHLIAYAVNSKNRLWYPFFIEYAHLFPNLNSKHLAEFNIAIYSNNFIKALLPRLSSFFYRYYQNPFFLTYIKSSAEIVELPLIPKESIKCNLLVLDGWNFRDSKNFIQKSQLLRRLFEFSEPVNNAAFIEVSKIKKFPDIYIVGIHIRRGDYFEWQGGRYYFGDETYLSAIQQITSLLNLKAKKAFFVICSNETISPSSPLLELPNVLLHQKSAIEDLCFLSKCDLLIGPPSTFTMWASFFGMVPLHYLEEEKSLIKLDDFSVRHC